MDNKARERAFQDHIIAELASTGWLVGDSAHYDKERALYPEDLIGFIQESQPEGWKKYCKTYGENPERHLSDAAVRQLTRSEGGTLWLLRNQIEDRGHRLKVASFKPDNDLNPELLTRYQTNRLRVVPELVYSPHGYDGRIDLTLFLNGIPVATLELKSCFKQSLENAKKQYRFDRQLKTLGKIEPLLSFRRGALVHFAVNQFEVAMTTKLAGESTFFLPFNKGTSEGGAGNDQPEVGYGSEYLWKEILQPDNFLRVLARYLHLEVKIEEDPLGKQKKKETMIFPRYHQWAVVQKLLSTVQMEGPGQKYLIQHSAGSGKSNSIAWLTHQLASLSKGGDKLFDSVIVVTDRTVLDSQLQETIGQFDHASGVVSRINRDEGDGSKSSQLTEALSKGTPIIIVTIQTFPHVLKAIQESTTLKSSRFAVVADEAHSSQSGSTARQLREVLMAEQVEEEMSAEDMMNLTLAARGGSTNISYFAFTATPKAKTLELFGRPDKLDMPLSQENKPKPFHVYSMRQAIEEGFILDVLKNYTNYSLAYKLAMQSETDSEVDSKKARTRLSKWVRLHPHNIGQKVAIIVEHFRSNVMSLLAGQAKAMVVTSSRLEAVRYKLAFDKYVKEQGYGAIQAMVAFSGEIEEEGQTFNERNMNPDLNGRDMRKAFDTQDYQVMLVANKFQTGFDQPKLCAMYVDKKLTGVDCIQTLSRLNRTSPGKDSTFVLDFVNDPQDVLEEFQKYYETAKLETVSDPNLVYDLFHKLKGTGIFTWSEVESFTDAYFDPKRGGESLPGYIKPAVDRFSKRYKLASEAIRESRRMLKDIELEGGSKTDKVNAERRVTEAAEARAELDLFKKDLNSYIRFYEFVSQITSFDDQDLERLCVFARHLLPMLRQEVLEEDEIDLSAVILSHYSLRAKRTQDLKLKEDAQGYGLEGVSAVGSAKAREEKKDFLSHILEQLNDLFGTEVTDGDKLDWLQGMASKIAENQPLMEQVRNNSRDAIMLGDFPKAVDAAVIERMDTQNGMSLDYLSRPDAANRIQSLLLDILLKGLGEHL
ncbi:MULTISPECIES: type I restriction endonuclease subunit R [Enterobacteriaceae]|uniref:type I restriction endonuclease subunit R n=1 Tax=Enterobacteriaceae TaxID=543 RepID=UPI0012B96A0F|nr:MULTISPECIES: DEAD/DEAH box helicase family protein [Enterobacteriaceae]MCE1464902.1 DEAD/DEAH box helicase family protein [Enterobacter roggenkampii]HBM3194935.1 type I restriction endonuclease subunit R [Klebsiella michiganensis]